MPHEDGQQKSHRPHARPTTLNLRKRKKRKLYYIILYYIILGFLKKVKLTLKYKYLQKHSGDYRVAKKSANPFFSTTS